MNGRNESHANTKDGADSLMGQRLHLLAVEDSTADARLLQVALSETREGQEMVLTLVRTMKDAEVALRDGRYDCVLLDLGLPDASGLANVERIRKVSRWQTVVVMTGLDDERMALEALQRGAQDYVVKGRYSGEGLVRAVRHAIERNRLLTEIDRLREQQSFLASHDALTGLPNRQQFEMLARKALANAERYSGHMAISCIDLDGFKPVNDTYGHAVGDALLRQIGTTLLQSVRENDTVARIGGDEFVVLLTPLQSQEEAEIVVRRILERIQAIKVVEGHDVNISASAGLALYPEHAHHCAQLFEKLLVCADKAMYAAKHRGRNRYRVYSADDDTRPGNVSHS